MQRTDLAETAVGAAVLAVAMGFIVYALSAGDRLRPDGYEVVARFGQVGSLAPGSAVRLAGVKIGSVESVSLDPRSFLAVVRLGLDPAIKVPSDSSAKIASDGLFGGAHIAIEPGGSPEVLSRGGEFQNTQGAIDLLGMIGQGLRPQTVDAPAAGAAK